MHRGAEKLFEVRDYRQIIVLANRHDWLSAFSNELGVVLAVERMLGMEVPVRAVWARTLLAELNRVLNHLMFLGSYPLELGAITPIFYAFRERETLQAVMEEISGGRMHYMFNRVGGLKEDLPAGWLGRVRHGRRRGPLAGCRRSTNLILGNEIFRARTAASASCRREPVTPYGVSGPIARASGVDFDLRRDEPYLAYGELPDVLRSSPAPRATATPGSSACSSRCKVSLDLADACVDRLRSLPHGPINVRLPKVLKAPEGHTYAWTENPLGHQRLLPGVPGREDPVAAEAALRVVQQHPGAAARCCRARWSPTWSRSSARCSSSSATSTSDRRRTPQRDKYVDWLRALSLIVVVLWHWAFTILQWKPGGPARDQPARLHLGAVDPHLAASGDAALLLHRRVRPPAVLENAPRRAASGIGRFVWRRIAALAIPGAGAAGHLDRHRRGRDAGCSTSTGCRPGGHARRQPAVVPRASTWSDRAAARSRCGCTAATACWCWSGWPAARWCVDVARFRYGIEGVGWLNMIIVWGLAHQAGFLYDRVVVRPAQVDWALLWTGLFGLFGLVFSGLYPGSMVGVPGDKLVEHGPAHLRHRGAAALPDRAGGGAAAVDGSVRWNSPRWRRVNETINRFALPLFLFHTTGMAIARVSCGGSSATLGARCHRTWSGGWHGRSPSWARWSARSRSSTCSAADRPSAEHVHDKR